MNISPVKADLLFETSWEVCNKIGGIYTVLSTKAKSLQAVYKNDLIFIGPDVWSAENPSPYFIESKTLLKDWRANTGLPEGVEVRVGNWDIPGRPVVVLVKFDSLYKEKDALYAEMWNRYGVDSLHAYGDYDEACAFSHAAGMVIESICKFRKLNGKNVIALFDEWTTGMGLLYIKWKMPRVATVFTTHATSIGRSICGNGKPLYDYMKGYNGDQMARELNMQSKHSLEKAAAHNADCFTTVSEVTAIECEQLLDKKPDIVTPNGFEPKFVPGKITFNAQRRVARKKILDIASFLTGKTCDPDSFIVATSGRCEYRNKGIDMFLDAIQQLRATDYNKPIIALILVPAWSKEPRADLLQAMESDYPDHKLCDPITSHVIVNHNQDAIVNRIHQLNFNNVVDDNLTVMYVPCYLNGNDGIFDLTYYQILPAIDATVFPSYYEPWGYTPLESIAFGIPTVTTTLSGFGQWVLSDCGDSIEQTGVAVVRRNDSNYNEVCDGISHILSLIIEGTLPKATLAKAAKETAAKADWSFFIQYYYSAFEIALKNNRSRRKK